MAPNAPSAMNSSQAAGEPGFVHTKGRTGVISAMPARPEYTIVVSDESCAARIRVVIE